MPVNHCPEGQNTYIRIFDRLWSQTTIIFANRAVRSFFLSKDLILFVFLFRSSDLVLVGTLYCCPTSVSGRIFVAVWLPKFPNNGESFFTDPALGSEGNNSNMNLGPHSHLPKYKFLRDGTGDVTLDPRWRVPTQSKWTWCTEPFEILFHAKQTNGSTVADQRNVPISSESSAPNTHKNTRQKVRLCVQDTQLRFFDQKFFFCSKQQIGQYWSSFHLFKNRWESITSRKILECGFMSPFPKLQLYRPKNQAESGWKGSRFLFVAVAACQMLREKERLVNKSKFYTLVRFTHPLVPKKKKSNQKHTTRDHKILRLSYRPKWYLHTWFFWLSLLHDRTPWRNRLVLSLCSQPRKYSLSEKVFPNTCLVAKNGLTKQWRQDGHSSLCAFLDRFRIDHNDLSQTDSEGKMWLSCPSLDVLSTKTPRRVTLPKWIFVWTWAWTPVLHLGTTTLRPSKTSIQHRCLTSQVYERKFFQIFQFFSESRHVQHQLSWRKIDRKGLPHSNTCPLRSLRVIEKQFVVLSPEIFMWHAPR